jgi:hypothetical protein
LGEPRTLILSLTERKKIKTGGREKIAPPWADVAKQLVAAHHHHHQSSKVLVN